MNYHNELNRLKQQYATNPATQQCFTDCIKAWCSFAKDAADRLDKNVKKSSEG
jgi:hypothetical protein